VYAFDIDREMIEATDTKARSLGLPNVVAVERDFVAEGTGLSEGSTGYAMLFNVLHAKEAASLLREAFRILRAQGGRRLPASPYFNCQIVDHSPTPGRLGSDPDRISQVPIAEDKALEHNTAVLDRNVHMRAIKVRIGAQRIFYFILQLLLGACALLGCRYHHGCKQAFLRNGGILREPRAPA
jgi:hypothetical protein